MSHSHLRQPRAIPSIPHTSRTHTTARITAKPGTANQQSSDIRSPAAGRRTSSCRFDRPHTPRRHSGPRKSILATCLAEHRGAGLFPHTSCCGPRPFRQPQQSQEQSHHRPGDETPRGSAEPRIARDAEHGRQHHQQCTRHDLGVPEHPVGQTTVLIAAGLPHVDLPDWAGIRRLLRRRATPYTLVPSGVKTRPFETRKFPKLVPSRQPKDRPWILCTPRYPRMPPLHRESRRTAPYPCAAPGPLFFSLKPPQFSWVSAPYLTGTDLHLVVGFGITNLGVMSVATHCEASS